MAKKEDNQEVKIIETGIVALDLQLGGGLPMGRVVELNGESAAGKSTMSLYLASKLLKQGKRVLYIDIERGVDEKMMNNMGLLPYIDSGHFELDQTTQLFGDLQKKIDDALGKDPKDRIKKPTRHEGTPDLIILDSLAMLMTDASKVKTIEDNVSNNMLKARYLTQFFSDIKGDLFETGTTFIFINHTQVKMKKVGFSMVIPTQDSAGSSIVKYGPDVRLYLGSVKEMQVTRKSIVGSQTTRIGATAEIYTKKSRVEDNGIKLPIKLIDAWGVFNGYTLKAICENVGWISGSGGHYYATENIVPKELKNDMKEKGYYICGTDNVEIYCQKNAQIIVNELKKAGLYRLTLDRAERTSILDVVTHIEKAKK